MARDKGKGKSKRATWPPERPPKNRAASSNRGQASEDAEKRNGAEEQAKRYRFKAEKYKNDPKATDNLLKDAQEKAKKQKGPLSDHFGDVMTLIRLVRAYRKGEYREVPWETIAMAIGALLYFLSPIDLIPDFIPVAGYVDDAAVISLVVVSIRTDLDNFRNWESEQKAA